MGEKTYNSAVYLSTVLRGLSPSGKSVVDAGGRIRPDAPKLLVEEAYGVGFSGVGYFEGADDSGVHLKGYEKGFRFPVKVTTL